MRAYDFFMRSVSAYSTRRTRSLLPRPYGTNRASRSTVGRSVGPCRIRWKGVVRLQLQELDLAHNCIGEARGRWFKHAKETAAADATQTPRALRKVSGCLVQWSTGVPSVRD